MQQNALDLVRLACDLPYLNQKDAKDLQFNLEYLQTRKEKIKAKDAPLYKRMKLICK